jgi:hypothetical protein
MPPRKTRRPPRTWTVDTEGEPIRTGGRCGLYVDLPRDDTTPEPGDWLATPAGSRYLVDDVHPVRHRNRTPHQRYQLQVLRLPKHTDPPTDVHVIWLSWYPRGKRY